MEVNIKVKTPKGHARITATRFDIKFLLPIGTKLKIKYMYISKEDDMFYWVVDIPAHKLPRLQKNVASYAALTNMALTKTISNKHVKKRMKGNWQGELKELFDETTIEIAKELDTENLIEIKNDSLWQKMKSKWQGVKQ